MDTELVLLLHIHSPQRYARDAHDCADDWTSQATKEYVLPLIEACRRLKADQIAFRLALALSVPLLLQTDRATLDLLADLEASGHLELVAAPAANAVLPLLLTDSSRETQVKAGIAAFRRCFGHQPRGFWLPGLSYSPGLSSLLAACGITWVVAEPAVLAGAHPAVSGAACQTGSGLTVLAADAEFEAMGGLAAPLEVMERLAHRQGLVVAPVEVSVPARPWAEGPLWIEQFFRALARQDTVTVTTPGAWLETHLALPAAQIRGGAAHGNLVTGEAARLWPRLHAAEISVADLAGHGSSARLERAAAALLDAQAADWAALCLDPSTQEYAAGRVTGQLAIVDAISSGATAAGNGAAPPGYQMLLAEIGTSRIFAPRFAAGDRPLRVLMLTWEFPPEFVGGLGRHVHDLGAAMAAAEHDVHVLTLADATVGPGTSAVSGMTVHRMAKTAIGREAEWPYRLNQMMVGGARELVAAGCGPFDVVHSHDWLTAEAGRTLRYEWSVPLIATYHVTRLGASPGGFRPPAADMSYAVHLEEWALAGVADRAITVSQAMAREVKSAFQIEPRVIYNATDTVEPAESPKRDWDAPYVLAMGRLVMEKGFDIAIRALGMMRHPIHLVIAGRPTPVRNMLAALAWTTGVADRVHFLGWVDGKEKDAWVQHATLGIVPSRYEPFGIVAIELMAAGVPVVVSDVGGLAEVTTDGIDGLRVPPGDPGRLAAALDWLLDNPRAAAQLGAAARSSVLRRFSWGEIAAQTVAVYRGQDGSV